MPDMHAPTALEPRKSPRQRRSANTVEDLIEAAARILERHGFEGYNTNAVARLAGVSIGSLYQYFPNKDAITRALILREAGTTLALVDRIGTGMPGAAIMNAIIDIAIERQLGRPRLARLIDLEEHRLNVLEAIAPSRSGVEQVIDACLSGIVSPVPEMASLDIVSIIKAIVDTAGTQGETDLPGLRSRLRRAVFGYLGRPELAASHVMENVRQPSPP